MNLPSLLFAVGISLSVVLLLASSSVKARSVAERIAPYVGGSRQANVSWSSTLSRSLRRFLIDKPESFWGSDARINVLLRKSGNEISLSQFRQNQLVYAFSFLLVALIWQTIKLSQGQGLPPALALTLMVAAVIFGGWFSKNALCAKANSRQLRMEQQLPTILDLLAFAVSAGEPITNAIKRVTQTCTGELCVELELALRSVSLGESFAIAFENLARGLDSTSVSRAVRTIIMAMDRGTPLAGVLRAQADDARAGQARKLFELAGKKETTMMLPVVFFILPTIVVIALYPGLSALQLM